MADKGETAILIDHETGYVYLDSTKRSWWTKAERAGMKLVRSDAPYRSYELADAADTLRVGVRKRIKISPEERERRSRRAKENLRPS